MLCLRTDVGLAEGKDVAGLDEAEIGTEAEIEGHI
jgi:hypothetical protein